VVQRNSFSETLDSLLADITKRENVDRVVDRAIDFCKEIMEGNPGMAEKILSELRSVRAKYPNVREEELDKLRGLLK
jgi:hypothetical protein